MILAVEVSERMFRAISQASDTLQLPQNQDFALHAMGLVLRSMGLAPKTGRPIGYRQRARSRYRNQVQKAHRRRPRL